MADPTPRPFEDILREVTFRDASVEVMFTDRHRVACMGTGGTLGHPKTYYAIGDKGYAECGYCDRVFVYDPARAGQKYEDGEFVTALAELPHAGSPAIAGDSGAS